MRKLHRTVKVTKPGAMSLSMPKSSSELPKDDEKSLQPVKFKTELMTTEKMAMILEELKIVIQLDYISSYP